MPVYRGADGHLVFHADPPGSFGDRVGDLFLANGFQRELWAEPGTVPGLKVLPQHLHRALWERFLSLENMGLALVTVRHPVDRLLDEFARTGGDLDETGFADWLTGAALEHLGNRLRPQVDFWAEGFEVVRAEDGGGSDVMLELEERLGVSFATLAPVRGYETRFVPKWSDAIFEAAKRFCDAQYADDFARFGYDPGESAAAAMLGGRVAPRRALRQRRYANAVVMPVRLDPAAGISRDQRQNRAARRGGAVDGSGAPITLSALVRHGTRYFQPETRAVEARVERRAVYGGPLFGVFGHFLLESLARLWVLAEPGLEDAVVAFSAGEEADMVAGAAGLRGYQREILAALGIGNEVVVVDRPTAFAELFVPEPGFEIPAYVHPDHIRFLERAGPVHEPEPGVKVWLSRSGLPFREGRTIGIAGLERRLAGAGWTVVHPEAMPWAEQVALLARAERVAGEEGSALHNVIFLRDAARLRVDILPRFGDLRPNYETIARAKGFLQVALYAGRPVVLRRRGPRVWKWHPGLARVLAQLT